MAVNLAMVIEEQGRKASWIAMKLGVSGSTITLWAQGKREIPPKRVKQLAELLGVSEAAILGTPLPVSQAEAPAKTRRRHQGAA